MRVAFASVLVIASAAVAAAQPAYTAKVEIIDKKGEHHAIVTSKLTCATPAKCPEWTLDLGRVDRAELLGVIDLRGAPTTVLLHTTGADIITHLPESAKLPAAFVRIEDVDGAGTSWTRIAAVSLEGGRAKAIWRGELVRHKKGTMDGFIITGDMSLVATAPDQPLAIEYDLHTILPPTTKRNGPTVHQRFVMKDGRYQRE